MLITVAIKMLQVMLITVAILTPAIARFFGNNGTVGKWESNSNKSIDAYQ